MSPLDLSPNYKLTAAILMGIVFGFTLIKSDLGLPASVGEALRLRNGRIIKTLLLVLAAGIVLFFVARLAGLARIQVRPAYFWGALLGGVICGIGLVWCKMTPTTAVTSFATGKFYAVWVLLGMMLALPAVSWVSDFLSRTVYHWSDRMRPPPEPRVFFAWDNPAMYAAGLLLGALLLVHFTVGDKEE